MPIFTYKVTNPGNISDKFSFDYETVVIETVEVGESIKPFVLKNVKNNLTRFRSIPVVTGGKLEYFLNDNWHNVSKMLSLSPVNADLTVTVE